MKFDIKNSVTRQEALSLMQEHWKFTQEQEIISLKDCLGRVTAENIFSENTLPVFRASCFDGVHWNRERYRGRKTGKIRQTLPPFSDGMLRLPGKMMFI
ncbi:MAG: hypothetical protein ACI4D3_13735 [Lachnospiraceae bacterium]